MTVQGLGVRLITALMRAERVRDLDTSWLLFGPSDIAEETAEEEPAYSPNAAFKYAAE